MGSYKEKSLYVCDDHGRSFTEQLVDNSLGTEVVEVAIQDFIDEPEKYSKITEHVVACGSVELIKKILSIAAEHGFSMGIIPLPHQKELIQVYNLPAVLEQNIKLALSGESKKIDLIYCNNHMMLFKTSFGKVPLLDSPVQTGFLQRMAQAVKRIWKFELFGLELTTASGRKISTAASGGMVIQNQTGMLASRLIGDDSSPSDGMISLVISAPMSVIEYLRLIFHILVNSPSKKHIASTLGLVKSSEIHIDCDETLDVYIDYKKSTQMPLTVSVSHAAVEMNVGPDIKMSANSDAGIEKLAINNLPIGRESLRAQKRGVPFFSYATEDRFKDLFSSLYEDARTNTIYMVLMVLSTLLATFGLYLNSSSIIIGAMLLAPLMAPIISLAMGVLRRNIRLLQASSLKICVGVVLALGSASLVVKLLPYDPVTDEMLARVNPSLLDLLVAILAGIGGAYTKSFKEILQSLAGVAIAVALVPPLAVAGIGLGRGDLLFFAQALLLFFTNFIGIVISASLTFRVLGYSSAIKAKKSLYMLFVMMAMILIPLYISYNQLVATYHFERAWAHERFLVGSKYLIVKDAKLILRSKKKIVTMTILARDRLNRHDLALLKKKIQQYYSAKIEIRADIIYIL